MLDIFHNKMLTANKEKSFFLKKKILPTNSQMKMEKFNTLKVQKAKIQLVKRRNSPSRLLNSWAAFQLIPSLKVFITGSWKLEYKALNQDDLRAPQRPVDL